MMAIDQSIIKNTNKKRIITLLSKERELTKLDIARILIISVPTVSTIVGELLEEGIVEQAGMAGSTGGRKPVIIKFKATSKFSLGVDITRKYIRVVLVDLDCKIIAEKSGKLSEIRQEDMIPSMKALIDDLIEENDFAKGKILGIGFSIPGIVDEENLKLEIATNFKLKDLSFRELEQYYDLPIYLENEANAGALAECKLGVAKELKNLIYISVSEGVGGGIIINQSIYKGQRMRAGEIGHMTVCRGGRICNCGKSGCWETYASNRALIDDYNKLSNKNVGSIKEIFEAYLAGENLAKETLQQYIGYLSEGIQNLIFVFNPDYVVIGGEISGYSNILIDKLKENVFYQNEFYKQDDVNILFSSLGGDSSILGAAHIPIMEGIGIGKV